jgi:co-chaperonin GroES (HSP10)
MDYIPLGGLIIALPIEVDEVTPGGIFIPEQARPTLNEATVEKVGPDVNDRIHKGVTIVFSQHSETRIKVDGNHYVCVDQDNVLMYKPAQVAALQPREEAAHTCAG